MSVLTVTGSVAIPDRTLPVDYTRSKTFVSRSQLPTRPDSLTISSYSNHATTATQSQAANSHRHSRTISSAILPNDPFSTKYSPASPYRSQQASPRAPPNHVHSRQSSTASMTTTMHRQGTTASSTSAPRRSASFRSTGTNAPTSYVALMRKQKATVWCDRSQNIDPRLAAQQRAAKQRATLEVHGTKTTSGRTSTLSSGGVVGKIRHGGIPKAPGYLPANMSGAGVPMRLSANELLNDDEEDGRSFGDNTGMIHGRSGSGKSSASSAKYRSGYPRQSLLDQPSNSNLKFTPPTNVTPQSISPGRESVPEMQDTRQEKRVSHRQERQYQQQRQDSKRSDSSEDDFGDFKELSGPNALQNALQDAKKAEDLKRRGSVDERAMSMGTGVRLFVANPDLDD